MTSTRLALFDLDGTLVDSVPDIATALNLALRDAGLAPATVGQVRNWIGNGVARLVDRALDGRTGDNDAAADIVKQGFERHYTSVNGAQSRVYAGTVETLQDLAAANIQLACVTNKPYTFAAALLARCDLAHFFGLVVGGDSLPAGKPDPLPLRHAAEVLGCRLEETVMIGDSSNDIEAARAAPCRIICVSYGYNHGRDIRSAGADHVIDTLEALPALIN